MMRTPASPGLPERESTARAAPNFFRRRSRHSSTNIRDQLGRILGPGGFDPARDIAGIAVNRWPHGYAPEYNRLFDVGTNANTPNIPGRQRFGRIAIANSDSGMAAYTDIAIDQAHRAVGELLAEKLALAALLLSAAPAMAADLCQAVTASHSQHYLLDGKSGGIVQIVRPASFPDDARAFVVKSDPTFEGQKFEIFPLGADGAGFAVHYEGSEAEQYAAMFDRVKGKLRVWRFRTSIPKRPAI